MVRVTIKIMVKIGDSEQQLSVLWAVPALLTTTTIQRRYADSVYASMSTSIYQDLISYIIVIT